MKRLLILLSCSWLSASAQEARVGARIDAGRITVGERARLFIEVQHNPAVNRIIWPAIPDTFNSLEIVERSPIDTVRQDNAVTYRQQLQITGFDSGAFLIPAFRFPVISTSGTADTLLSEPFPLLVETVLVDTTKAYRGIKEIIYVRSSWTDYIWWILGGALLAAGIAVLVWYLARRKKETPPAAVPPPPTESLHARYTRLLDELDSRRLWQQDRIKEYYVSLTDILRDYIEERFQTPAMELTTDELLDKARRHADMRTQLFLLEQILRTADLAKFAKAQPLPQEHTGAMEAARKFIQSTIPVHSETTRNKP